MLVTGTRTQLKKHELLSTLDRGRIRKLFLKTVAMDRLSIVDHAVTVFEKEIKTAIANDKPKLQRVAGTNGDIEQLRRLRRSFYHAIHSVAELSHNARSCLQKVYDQGYPQVLNISLVQARSSIDRKNYGSNDTVEDDDAVERLAWGAAGATFPEWALPIDRVGELMLVLNEAIPKAISRLKDGNPKPPQKGPTGKRSACLPAVTYWDHFLGNNTFS